jgi:hypothetical protein
MPIILTPNPEDSGYYAILRYMKVVSGGAFDKEFNLAPNALGYDPDLAALVQGMADTMVDSIAYEVGLTPDETATGNHFIAPDNQPIFGALQIWASRWARAQGHLIRGEDYGGDADDEALSGGDNTSGAGSIEGKMTRMRREAESRIKSLLTAYYERSQVAKAVRHNGIAVGRICNRPFYGRKFRGYWYGYRS